MKQCFFKIIIKHVIFMQFDKKTLKFVKSNLVKHTVETIWFIQFEMHEIIEFFD